MARSRPLAVGRIRGDVGFHCFTPSTVQRADGYSHAFGNVGHRDVHETCMVNLSYGQIFHWLEIGTAN